MYSPPPDLTRAVSRRRVLSGAAWAAPVVTLAHAAPAAAASCTPSSPPVSTFSAALVHPRYDARSGTLEGSQFQFAGLDADGLRFSGHTEAVNGERERVSRPWVEIAIRAEYGRIAWTLDSTSPDTDWTPADIRGPETAADGTSVYVYRFTNLRDWSNVGGAPQLHLQFYFTGTPERPLPPGTDVKSMTDRITAGFPTYDAVCRSGIRVLEASEPTQTTTPPAEFLEEWHIVGE
ncbi:hypothetical protein [Falsarthrobacter nasiphocae]|uniref:Uncharacterized protein n=1 Tax=Falsarthrobacter nasiphocae TaxID=189863 RepID=A0AAE4C6W6_9MICC|nr:hypothetical protein [Falsarthrobacter nasiphocae]MDR6892597.1 hypothetical protein [Falsarthrobacter nasiphocae]